MRPGRLLRRDFGEFILPYDVVRAAAPDDSCSNSCKAPTRPPRTWHIGTAPAWSAPRMVRRGPAWFLISQRV